MAVDTFILEMFSTLWFIVKWFWWLGLLITIMIMKIVYKKYPIAVTIIEKRGDNHIVTNDRAGKFMDPYTQLTGYKLLKSKDTIPVVDYDWILHFEDKQLSIFERLANKLRGNSGMMFLFKYGSKQYKPVRVNKDGKTKLDWQEVKDSKGNPILISVLKPIDPRDKLAGLNFDVVDWDNMNFMVQEMRTSNERRKKQSEFWKQILIPAMIIGGAVVFAIVISKYGMDSLNAFLAKMNTGTPAPVQEDPTNPNIPIINNIVPN